MNSGSVALVGAGCGTADLITLRGMRLLQRCDAVVYDDLIDPALLELAPPQAQRVYMGKRCGRHSAPQESISQTLVTLAQQGKTVVRLKGGDPFVFGRGGEEMLALRQAQIPCEYVPGISSSIAIPGEAGIPVTHRGLSRSLHVITSHTALDADGLPLHLSELAKLEGTLVFLMGLGRLGAIAQGLIQAGMSPETPAAVVSGGNAPAPACVRAPLDRIAQAAQGVQPPAVIVVGAVAGMDLSPRETLPLWGAKVWLTGTQAVTEPLTAILRTMGAGVWTAAPAVPKALPFPLKREDLSAAPWLVFTSANGVECFFRGMAEQAMDLRLLAGCRLAAIGQATGAALAQHGLFPDLLPQEFTSRGLAQALIQAVRPGEEVLLLRSRQGSPELPQLLTDARVSFRDLPLYQTEVAETSLPAVPPHYLVFASAGGVAEFFRCHPQPLPDTTCVAIGPVTAKALEEKGISCLMAEEISTQGIAQTIAAHWNKRA